MGFYWKVGPFGVLAAMWVIDYSRSVCFLLLRVFIARTLWKLSCLSIHSIYPWIHLSIYTSIHVSIYQSIHLSIYQFIYLHLAQLFIYLYRIYLFLTQKKKEILYPASRCLCTIKTFRLPCISLPRFVHNLRYQLFGTQWFRGTTPGFLKKKRHTFQNRGRIQYLETNWATKLSSWELTYHLFWDHLWIWGGICWFPGGCTTHSWRMLDNLGLSPWKSDQTFRWPMDFGNRPARRSKCPRSPSMCWDTSGGHLVSAMMTGQPTPLPGHYHSQKYTLED